MGNTLSGILAEIVMDELVSFVITTLTFMIPFFWLYVDDSITAIPEGCHDIILEAFNTFHPKIQFTIEKEENMKIAFLDVEVQRTESGELTTNWYVKSTNSGRILNFRSNNPINHKMSIIRGLLYRMVNLSHVSYHDANLRRIRTTLSNNNYPKSFVNQCIHSFFTNQHGRTSVQGTTSDSRYFRFPFVQGLSQAINGALNNNTQLAYYNVQTTNCLFTRLKDPTPLDMLSNVIYRIPCSCGKSYIGQTRQYLKLRIGQHKNYCKNHNQAKTNKAALALHHFSTGHDFKFEETTVLDRKSNWFRRNMGEMVQIQLTENINLRTDCLGLSAIYHNIINLFSQHRI
ncbi:uncharacterized protein LOC123313972 [Coccinella septempunctata]|uniref:uncharacterized protein LOC123313972 n=1 Tax=Coccinella septempunctata TaxID=41139 RepID=UPI001D063D18|nr:uncharacterized protein LOC123313972 [Coccinella septempunctata]